MSNSDFLYSVGLSIRKFRSIAGISQEELGARTECDKNTIGKIERGETDFRISTLHRIANGLNISFSRLIKEAEANTSEPLASTIEYDFLRLFQYCHELSPEQFNLICNAALLYAKDNQLIKQLDQNNGEHRFRHAQQIAGMARRQMNAADPEES